MSISATCKACQARLIWAITPTGAKAPIDRDPVEEDGNVLLLFPTGLPDPLAVTLSGYALETARKSPVKLRLNHFATCPDRDQFKQEKD